jgi:hypothetical protein
MHVCNVLYETKSRIGSGVFRAYFEIDNRHRPVRRLASLGSQQAGTRAIFAREDERKVFTRACITPCECSRGSRALACCTPSTGAQGLYSRPRWLRKLLRRGCVSAQGGGLIRSRTTAILQGDGVDCFARHTQGFEYPLDCVPLFRGPLVFFQDGVDDG